MTAPDIQLDVETLADIIAEAVVRAVRLSRQRSPYESEAPSANGCRVRPRPGTGRHEDLPPEILDENGDVPPEYSAEAEPPRDPDDE